jgi:para-aminobenzoate synthetase/4-amino-4-deoxychorismate lyase
MLAYEAAPAFEPAMVTQVPGRFPLAWAGIFNSPAAPDAGGSAAQIPDCEWKSCISFREYCEGISRIHSAIARGDCYQVNYTFPLRCPFQGNSLEWFHQLGAALGAGYCAWLDIGEHVVLSLSPELFFERLGNRLRTRPMKGTLPRGRWNEEDAAQRELLRTSAKNQAENVMIVDLLRNDLGRVSQPGSVEVTRLFEVEKYETLFQMTSTIESVCRADVSLVDLLQALFPSGSVTGAPKISAMNLIRQLEPHPRGAYTGAIGLIRPGGDCIFSVAIRTLVIEKATGQATFGVGGGITYDSTAEDEYEECLTKARFLSHARPTFDLLETLLLEHGQYFLLERHLSRMRGAAEYFNFAWEEPGVRQKLEELRLSHSEGFWRVRLLASRSGRLGAESVALTAEPEKIRRVGLADKALDSRSPFLCHKTTHRSFYDEPVKARQDCDDLIFLNERGEVTESSIANVVLVKGGVKLTPARACGLLAGVFREELLARQILCERILTKEDLLAADEIWLVNSVRRWMRVALVGVEQRSAAKPCSMEGKR